MICFTSNAILYKIFNNLPLTKYDKVIAINL